MNWDPLQRDVLEALGHVVYAVGGQAVAEAAPASRGERTVPAAGTARPDAQTPSPQAGPEESLLRALARAAGLDPADPAALARCRALLPPGGLRDAASRRALWPALRALRAGMQR